MTNCALQNNNEIGHDNKMQLLKQCEISLSHNMVNYR